MRRGDMVLGIRMSEAKEFSWKSWDWIVEMRDTVHLLSECCLHKGRKCTVADSWSAVCKERDSSRDIRSLKLKRTQGGQCTTQGVSSYGSVVIRIKLQSELPRLDDRLRRTSPRDQEAGMDGASGADLVGINEDEINYIKVQSVSKLRAKSAEPDEPLVCQSLSLTVPRKEMVICCSS